MRMKRSVLITTLFIILGSLPLFAQRTVQLGGHSFVPEQNMGIGHPAGTRGNRAIDTKHLGTATNSQRNALI